MSSRVLTAVAWPYANGPRHIGHVSGFGVPSDVFSRYRRMVGRPGAHGQRHGRARHPDPGAGRRRGAHPARSSPTSTTGVIAEDLQGLGLAYDLFTRTTTSNHYEVVQELFLALHRNGYVVAEDRDGRDQPVHRAHAARPLRRGHLPDLRLRRRARRPVRQLRQPARPRRPDQPPLEDQRRDAGVRRDRALLPRPARVRRVARARGCPPAPTGGPNVLKFATNLVDDLKPRAITRDLDWGVPIPLDGWRDQPMKRLYVWFDAVIGYLSASVEWARRGPRPGRVEAVVDRPGRPGLLLHGQGQHRLPLGDLARAAARAERARATTAATPGRVRHAEPAERDRLVGVPHDERLEVLHEPRHRDLRRPTS